MGPAQTYCLDRMIGRRNADSDWLNQIDLAELDPNRLSQKPIPSTIRRRGQD